MSDKEKYFDLHIECGATDAGDFYAKTILGVRGGIVYHKESKVSLAHAMVDLINDFQVSGMWSTLAQNPQTCVYPFPGTQTPLAVSIDPKAPKKRSSDLSQVTHPNCQMQCISFDHFGDSKCKSMCPQRSGL